MRDTILPGAGALSPTLRHFLEKLLDGLRADERVAGIWAVGSLASDAADRWSDIALLIAVRDAQFVPLAADWRAFLDRLTPTRSASTSVTRACISPRQESAHRCTVSPCHLSLW